MTTFSGFLIKLPELPKEEKALMFHVPAQAYALRRRSTKKTGSGAKNLQNLTPFSSFDQTSSFSHDSDTNLDANGCCEEIGDVSTLLGLNEDTKHHDLRVRLRFTENTDKIESEEDQSPDKVVVKDDHGRFPQQYTLKLRTSTEYVVQMEVCPPHHICYVKIGGRRHDNFKLLQNSEDKKTVSFLFSTKKCEVTGRAYRAVFPCSIKFKPCTQVVFDLQIKFYKSKEEEHYTGESFSFLELECSGDNGKKKNTVVRKMSFK